MIGPILQGRITNLAPFMDHHLSEKYVRWLNDPEVVRYSEQRHRKHDLESCSRYVQACREGNILLWAIETKEAQHVGNISATIDQANRVAELAILLGERTLWNCGMGYDAWSTAMNFLLTEFHMRKVTAGTMSENTSMLALMSKSGMVREARLVGHFLLDRHSVDMIIASRFAADADQDTELGSSEKKTGGRSS